MRFVLQDLCRGQGCCIDCQAKVRATGADLGLAFDGDADRCFFIDERGEPVPPSAIVGLVAARELARYPGSAIVHNVITSAAAVEIIREHGGRPIRSRVGHSYMKALMAEHDAVFGGEHSGHYYFRDFWRADTGMLTAMHVLAALGGQDRARRHDRTPRRGTCPHPPLRKPRTPVTRARATRPGRSASPA